MAPYNPGVRPAQHTTATPGQRTCLIAPADFTYSGPTIEEENAGGERESYVKPLDVAAEWSLDYPALRNFVRDRTSIASTKYPLCDPERPERKTQLVVIRASDLPRLHECLLHECQLPR